MSKKQTSSTVMSPLVNTTNFFFPHNLRLVVLLLKHCSDWSRVGEIAARRRNVRRTTVTQLTSRISVYQKLPVVDFSLRFVGTFFVAVVSFSLLLEKERKGKQHI